MFRLVLIVFAICTTLAGARAAPVYPPGLQTGLEPVADLRAEPGFPGFQDRDRKVAVVIAELPVATYDKVADTMFGKDPPGATHVTRESFPFNSGIGFLQTGDGTENGAPFRRWILVAKPIHAAGELLNFVVVVNVTVPNAARDTYTEAVVRKMLFTVAFRPPPIDERLNLIPFEVGDFAGFRVMRVLPEGLILTDGPKDDVSSQASMIVSIGRVTPEQATDRARFARDLLALLPVGDLTMTAAEDQRIGGRPGYEIRARGKDEKGETLSVVQWVRFMGNGFLRFVGVSRSEQWDAMFNRFRTVRDATDMRRSR
jgi:hypothetical protein